MLERELIILGRYGGEGPSLQTDAQNCFCTDRANGYPKHSVVCSLSVVLFFVQLKYKQKIFSLARFVQLRKIPQYLKSRKLTCALDSLKTFSRGVLRVQKLYVLKYVMLRHFTMFHLHRAKEHRSTLIANYSDCKQLIRELRERRKNHKGTKGLR